jgi:hypothetical protein
MSPAEDYEQRMKAIVADRVGRQVGMPINPVPPGMRQKTRVKFATHFIDYEDENKDGVTIVIEPKIPEGSR